MFKSAYLKFTEQIATKEIRKIPETQLQLQCLGWSRGFTQYVTIVLNMV